jgi:hypothetical protein
VIDTTTIDPPLSFEASGPLGRMLDSTASGLRDALAAAVRTRVPLGPAFSTSGEVTLVSRSTVALSRPEARGDSSRHPDIALTQPPYVAFSAIGFSPDRRSAAVYAEYHCGALCGGAYAVVLTRHPARSWQIQHVHTRLRF